MPDNLLSCPFCGGAARKPGAIRALSLEDKPMKATKIERLYNENMRTNNSVVLDDGTEWWDDSPMFNSANDKVLAQLRQLDPLDPRIDEVLIDMAMNRHALECYFCHTELHPDNNAMTRCTSGLEPASRGFGWISCIVPPFHEVPCCDICMEDPNITAGAMF